MSYTPGFMQQLELFYQEAGALNSIEDWASFEAKWFQIRDWPKRSLRPRHFSQQQQQQIDDDGRGWTRSSWSYDLTAEARYHYFAVFLEAGQAVRFPHLDKAETSDTNWIISCPYCEISTVETGSLSCPVCNRLLLDEYIEDG